MAIKTIPLSRLEMELKKTLDECAESGDTIVVEMPNQRLLSIQPFYLGINDTLGGDPTGAAFNPVAMTLFDAWTNLPAQDALSETRRAVAVRHRDRAEQPEVVEVEDRPRAGGARGR